MAEPKKGSGKLSAIRKKPGESNAFKYKGVKSFAGPDQTFPINSKARARNALSRAHFAKNPESIRAKVHSKYPSIGKSKK
jgi:hypothetical protein